MKEYSGFEVGPIRPPSEADSLLLRVTRNCPWNKCRFCTLYKGEKFSIRDKEDLFKDIDLVREIIDVLENAEGLDYEEINRKISNICINSGENADWAVSSALNFYRSDMKSIFLQDADTMITKPDDLVSVLEYVKKNFPNVDRITTYGRSSSLSHISDADMKRLAEAGLNRVHMGMESGSDKVLELVKKGTTKEKHITAGRRVKDAGIELSVYYMPGLGGVELSDENAIETADVINKINPDFVRIRTLAIREDSLLKEDYENGVFQRTNDTKMVEELRLMISNLKGINSYVASDHIINLIPEVNGRLPEDKDKMLAAIDWYIGLSESDKMIYRIGRRTGVIAGGHAFSNETLKFRVKKMIERDGVTADNIDETTDNLINRYI